MVFVLGGHRFAVSPRQIVEVAQITAYTPLPCEDPSNLGVTHHRDRLIPLVNLSPRPGIARSSRVELPWMCLVVKTDLGEIGFLLDQVLGFESSADGCLPGGITRLDLDRLEGWHAKSASD